MQIFTIPVYKSKECGAVDSAVSRHREHYRSETLFHIPVHIAYGAPSPGVLSLARRVASSGKNLLPIGQLDGGHISHALFGSRDARGISLVAMISLFLLAPFVWPRFMFWAFIVFFVAGTRDAPCRERPHAGRISASGPWLFRIFAAAAHHCARPGFAL
jgi:hypothetical protein